MQSRDTLHPWAPSAESRASDQESPRRSEGLSPSVLYTRPGQEAQSRQGGHRPARGDPCSSGGQVCPLFSSAAWGCRTRCPGSAFHLLLEREGGRLTPGATAPTPPTPRPQAELLRTPESLIPHPHPTVTEEWRGAGRGSPSIVASTGCGVSGFESCSDDLGHVPGLDSQRWR